MSKIVDIKKLKSFLDWKNLTISNTAPQNSMTIISSLRVETRKPKRKTGKGETGSFSRWVYLSCRCGILSKN